MNWLFTLNYFSAHVCHPQKPYPSIALNSCFCYNESLCLQAEENPFFCQYPGPDMIPSFDSHVDDRSLFVPADSVGDAGQSISNSITHHRFLTASLWWIAFVTIIIIGGVTRSHTLLFPHDHGDQIIYTALADNIQHGRDYSLTCVAITSMPCHIPDTRLLGFLPAQSPTQSVAWLFKSAGADIYRESLFFRVPLFPVMQNNCRQLTGTTAIRLLSLPAMRASGSPAEYYFRWYHTLDPGSYAAVSDPQAPAALPPLLFSICIIGITMLWTRR